MTKVLVLYYSSYGHTETMANAVSAGSSSVEGVKVTLERVSELVSEDVAKGTGIKLDQVADYDAIIFGTSTRFGNMAEQMRNFLDQTGGLWVKGKLIGNIGSVFTSTGTGGGNKPTIQSFHKTLFHHDILVVGLPFVAQELIDLTEVKGGSPLGVACLVGADGSRQPSEKELSMGKFQGKHVATSAVNLVGLY